MGLGNSEWMCVIDMNVLQTCETWQDLLRVWLRELAKLSFDLSSKVNNIYRNYQPLLLPPGRPGPVIAPLQRTPTA